MNMYHLSPLLSLLWISFMSHLLGQPSPDTAHIDHILVGKSASVEKNSPSANYYYSFEHSSDFYRRPELRLMNFNWEHLQVIAEATAIDHAPNPGLVGHLVWGLRQQKIRAYHPSDRGREYSYRTLMLDMARLQGLDVDTMGRLTPDMLMWERLEQEMLVLWSRGYNNKRAREFSQPENLYLIWTDLQQGERHLLAIFEMEEIGPWLEQLQCRWQDMQGRKTGTNARRWLFAHRRECPMVNMNAKAWQMLPEDRRSLDEMPDFFEDQY